MFTIDDKTKEIRVTKNDDFSFKVNLYYSDESTYTLAAQDVLTFTVKVSKYSKIILIQKTADSSGIFTVTDEDTDLLTPDYAYVYDIQLTQADGKISTVVPISSFVVGYQVTE